MNIFEKCESEVRSYCRKYPIVFKKSKGSFLFDQNEDKYLDFLSGAGAINYGHNNDYILNGIKDYIYGDGILHALDMYTVAKEEFIEKFNSHILNLRGLKYKFMFCGPTGTNAIEAALKLARKVKERKTIFSFMGSFHGMSLGSLALTSDRNSRAGAGVSLDNVVFMPFPYGYNKSFDTIDYIENVLIDDHSGIELPAAIIVETVQAEGGIVIADVDWLKRLRILCNKYDILLICDEIQVGCGRTGTFFSFERAEIKPDMVVLSKSISGIGFPMSLLLFKPELDNWKPGEHNGTFRGNQLAFVAAKAAIEYMEKEELLRKVREKEIFITNYIEKNILTIDSGIEHRGIGMIHGIDFSKYNDGRLCCHLISECFKRHLIIESAGRKDLVLKILPPLTTTLEELNEGLDIITDLCREVLR